MSSTSASSEPNAGRKTPGRGQQEDDDRILVGVVLRAHGIRGEVKVKVLSDIDDRFAAGSRFHLVPRDGPPRGGSRTVTVVGSRRHQGTMLLTLDGVADRDAAEALRGARLEVDPDDVPDAPDGFYYHFQLVGCECHDEHEGHLGTVRDVVDDGGGSLLVVELATGSLNLSNETSKKGGRRVPIPFVNAFLRNVDVDDRRIDLSLPEGLIETCTSRS